MADIDWEDPKRQALLALAAGLLSPVRSRGGAGFGEALGRGIQSGLMSFNSAANNRRRSELEDIQKRMGQIQLDSANRESDFNARNDSLVSQYFQPGYTPSVETDELGNKISSYPAKADFSGYITALPGLGGKGVDKAIALQQAIQKDTLFDKVSPKDYTAESIKNYMLTRDASVLVPVRKMEVQDGTVFDPYAAKPGSTVSGPQSKVIPDGVGGWTYNPALVSPADQFNAFRQHGEYLGKSAEQQYNIGRGYPSIPSPSQFFLTGVGGMPPTGPIQRQQGPQVSATSPSPYQVTAPAPSGMTPKQESELRFDAAKQDEKRARGSSSVVDLLNRAESILRDPETTGSYVGRAVDYVSRITGKATTGDENTARLQGIGGALLVNMPRMEGPQSDRDVMNYRQAAGLVDDATVPTSVRLAALETIREINQKYSGMNEKTPDKPLVKNTTATFKAKDAIAKGANRRDVILRMRQAGFDTEGL